MMEDGRWMVDDGWVKENRCDIEVFYVKPHKEPTSRKLSSYHGGTSKYKNKNMEQMKLNQPQVHCQSNATETGPQTKSLNSSNLT